jgi:hypothetical protein
MEEVGLCNGRLTYLILVYKTTFSSGVAGIIDPSQHQLPMTVHV